MNIYIYISVLGVCVLQYTYCVYICIMNMCWAWVCLWCTWLKVTDMKNNNNMLVFMWKCLNMIHSSNHHCTCQSAALFHKISQFIACFFLGLVFQEMKLPVSIKAIKSKAQSLSIWHCYRNLKNDLTSRFKTHVKVGLIVRGVMVGVPLPVSRKHNAQFMGRVAPNDFNGSIHVFLCIRTESQEWPVCRSYHMLERALASIFAQHILNVQQACLGSEEDAAQVPSFLVLILSQYAGLNP
jgi:hypothetical protein